MKNNSDRRWSRLLAICVYGNAFVIALVGLTCFIIPSILLVHDVRDPALRTGEMPNFVYRWHRGLSGRFETWARERVASGQAAGASLRDISGTEWPIFSSVYYLWATEALQGAWEEDPSLSRTMPSEYARGAIEAAAALIVDPGHASWVRKHWGDDYLYTENIFYRMLYISGLTSYQKLSGDDGYQELLLSQIEALSRELDASPYGLLDDYPGQCYPIDILPAIAAIQRADGILGTDHSASVARASRAFEGARLDAQTGLPAYVANARTGVGIGPARGVGVSYMLIWLPELWPEKAREWYTRFDEYYWQENLLMAGFREYPEERFFPDWYFADVDAGPVIGGFGTAASAFGIGGARANGRLDQAYPLSGEALVASWPLADGTLLGPRLLSNLSDAPYLGESALLFNFTRTPVAANVTAGAGRLPAVVFAGILLYILLGVASIGFAIAKVRKWYAPRLAPADFPMPRLQLLGWLALIASGAVMLMSSHAVIGGSLFLAAQFLPKGYRSEQGWMPGTDRQTSNHP